MERPTPEITQLLMKWRSGDPAAAENLMPMVYSELKIIARRLMASERSDHTLQPTALVHEAFLQLSTMDVPWQDSAHFLAICARAMRRILVDHARAKHADKRGGKETKVDLDVALAEAETRESAVIALDEALQKLVAFDSRKSAIIELHYFGGLKQDQIALVLSISVATVERELRAAKTWLQQQLAAL